MEKGKGPPPENFPGPMEPPPYPGPPLDESVLVNQPPPAAQPVDQSAPGPSYEPTPQPVPQSITQSAPGPAPQLITQPASGPNPQPAPQQYPQQYHQQHVQQHPQYPQYPQQYLQYPQPVQVAYQQPQSVQPVSVVMVQGKPTNAPGQMFCPHCQNSIVTKINHKVGLLTWIICGVMGVLFIWPCCLIPFCVNSCKDVEHSCPTCHKVLHTYARR